MFTVRITFLDCIDEFGYMFNEYTFEDVNEAREFLATKQADYKDNDLVSITANC